MRRRLTVLLLLAMTGVARAAPPGLSPVAEGLWDRAVALRQVEPERAARLFESIWQAEAHPAAVRAAGEAWEATR